MGYNSGFNPHMKHSVEPLQVYFHLCQDGFSDAISHILILRWRIPKKITSISVDQWSPFEFFTL